MRHLLPPAGLQVHKHKMTTRDPNSSNRLRSGGGFASRHGLQRVGGAVGQSLPQIQDLDHRQDAQVFGQTAAPQLLGLARRASVREFYFTPTSTTAQKRTHPLHGEELDLIGPAFEKPEDVLEHGHGALQVTGGSLTHCATRRIDYDLTNQQ